MRADDVGRKCKKLGRRGLKLENLATWVDKKEKITEKLLKDVADSNDRFLTAEQEFSRAMRQLSKEDCKRYEFGQSYNLEALDAIKDTLVDDAALLDGLVQAMPDLPLPSALTTMHGAAGKLQSGHPS